MNFYAEDGEYKINAEDAAKRVTDSIKEMEGFLEEAKRFKANLEAGTLEDGQGFLDFTGPIIHGYDRTGPKNTCVYIDEM